MPYRLQAGLLHEEESTMEFKLYGYILNDTDLPTELREVTLCIDASQAQALSDFFARCAEQMRSDAGWEHAHFAGGGERDIIVYNVARLAG